MPREKEAVSFWHNILVVGERTHTTVRGFPWAEALALPSEASRYDGVSMLVLSVWSDSRRARSSLNAFSRQGLGGGINQRVGRGSFWVTLV